MGRISIKKVEKEDINKQLVEQFYCGDLSYYDSAVYFGKIKRDYKVTH